MEEIATRPTPKVWIGYIATFLLLTIIGAILPLLALTYFTLSSPEGKAPLWAIAGCFIISALAASGICQKMINRHYWRLNHSELIGGLTKHVCFPLSSVEKIVVGLPTATPIPGTGKLMPPSILQHFIIQQQISLLLVFQDKSMLPLNLHATPNGTTLMTELVNRLNDRIVQNHGYSKEEIRHLRGALPNILLRKG